MTADIAELHADLASGRLGWQVFARCAEVGDAAFFPRKGESVMPVKRICLRCEVRERCLEYALGFDGLQGVWGGMSERERVRFKRQQREGRAA